MCNLHVYCCWKILKKSHEFLPSSSLILIWLISSCVRQCKDNYLCIIIIIIVHCQLIVLIIDFLKKEEHCECDRHRQSSPFSISPKVPSWSQILSLVHLWCSVHVNAMNICVDWVPQYTLYTQTHMDKHMPTVSTFLWIIRSHRKLKALSMLNDMTNGLCLGYNLNGIIQLMLKAMAQYHDVCCWCCVLFRSEILFQSISYIRYLTRL